MSSREPRDKERPSRRKRIYVGVVGGAKAPPEEQDLAYRVGQLVAKAGAVVVCGGLGGAMEGACRGAHDAGGLTIGILPGTKRRDANRFVDLALPTGMGEARNTLVVRASDCLVAVSGEFGTLSEIAFALAVGVPVVGLGTWEIHRSGLRHEPFVRAKDPEQAVALALQLASGIEQPE